MRADFGFRFSFSFYREREGERGGVVSEANLRSVSVSSWGDLRDFLFGFLRPLVWIGLRSPDE